MAKFKNSNLILKTNQEVILGDSAQASIKYDGASLVLAGPISFTQSITPSVSGTIDIGSTSLKFNVIHASSVNADGIVLQNAGITISRTGTNAKLIWDESSSAFKAGLEGSEEILATKSYVDAHTSADWNDITNKPTTLAGYGITDAVNVSEVVTTPQPNKILKLDSNGDLPTDITGNAATATQLYTPRSIILSGDVTGSAYFDGTGDSTITTSVANDSHNHSDSTITSVNWSKLQSIPSPTITLSGDVSGTGTMTSLGDVIITATVANDSHTHDGRYFTETESDARYVLKAGDTISGDLVVSGNLTVSGTTTTVNTQTLSIADNIITLNSDFTSGTPTENAGMEVLRGSSPTVQLRWNEANDYWELTEDGTNYYKIWHSGNDGAGSTLDADLLDGQNGSYYLDFSNFTNLPSPTITLAGDASGTATLTNLGNATLTVTVVDNSHSHISANISDADTANTANTIVKRDSSGNFSAGTITATLNGNASTASKLQTARTISLSGDVTGSASFDGSSNVTITAAVADNSHSHTYSNISDAYLFWNNFGDTHSTRSSFDPQGSPSTVNYGWRYVQGSTNGPGVSGAVQYYSCFVGLGSNYDYNQYGMQLAIPRTSLGGSPYLCVRFEESGSFQSWQKIYAGYADSAGSANDSDTLDGFHASSFVRSDNTNQNNSFDSTYLVFSYADASNVDHIWRDDTNNVYHFVFDAPKGTQGNATIKCANATLTGTLTAAQKSFEIEHPTKPGYKLRHGSLEGPENGVYVRGKLVGNDVIELPEYWTNLVDADSITVNLTSIGKYQQLYVKEIVDNKIYIGIENGNVSDISCFFTVFGERIDVDRLVVEYPAE